MRHPPCNVRPTPLGEGPIVQSFTPRRVPLLTGPTGRRAVGAVGSARCRWLSCASRFGKHVESLALSRHGLLSKSLRGVGELAGSLRCVVMDMPLLRWRLGMLLDVRPKTRPSARRVEEQLLISFRPVITQLLTYGTTLPHNDIEPPEYRRP